MPKMSIKKKHPNTTTAAAAAAAVSAANASTAHTTTANSHTPTSTSLVHTNATITRKRLFQFLFKNYIKSAYSGIAREQPAATSHSHSNSTSTSSNTAASSSGGGGPSTSTIGRQQLPHQQPHQQQAYGGALSESSMLSGEGGGGGGSGNVAAAAAADGIVTSSACSTATAAVRHHPSGSTGTVRATTSGSYRAAVALRKRELRTEYFNDMSECYTQSQRYRRVEQPLVAKIIMQHRKVPVTAAAQQQQQPAATATLQQQTPPQPTQPTQPDRPSAVGGIATTGQSVMVDSGSGGCRRNKSPTRQPHQRRVTMAMDVDVVGGGSSLSSSAAMAATAAPRSRAMTVTQLMDRQISQNDDIGWGKKVSVTLVREPTTSFGVCIVGGKVNISKNLQVAGIFIKNIVPASPAETCKQIKIGDRILSVNQQDVRNATQEETIGLIKNAGCRIELVLQSFDGSNLPDASAQMPLKSAIKADTSASRNRSVKISSNADRSATTDSDGMATAAPEAAPATTTATQRVTSGSDSSSSDEETEESSGKVTTKAGYDIDRKSAGNLKRTKEEAAADPEPENNFGYTDQKLKKKFGPLGGKIIRAIIQRDAGSLGLALAGCRDRTKMGCFVAGINPKGTASSQNVKVGDEILEISGVFLHRMCHLNASVIIKGIPGIALEFILLRLDNAVEEMAVKPVLSFPAAFDQFDQLYSCFKNVRNVTIQKVGTSLGIMIIEGKHSEVGQGIFISDIQENSNAETAGVKIGEMVLAVNKDLLIDTNYDTAAGLLKRAEGIVTLTLCNPNKKEGEADGKPDEADGKVEAKKPEPPPEPEVPKDPATTPILANRDTVIEINAEKKPLGIVVVKGDSSQVQSGASVIVIHENGAVHKDNRLQVFDKIVEIDGKKISSESSDHDINKIFQTLYPRVKMTVYRAEPPDLKEMDVEITKKSGKDIGLSFAECKNNGIYVLDIVAGSEVDKDKRMIRGDIVTHINGDDIRKSNFIESTVLLKAAQPKITFKVVRPKGKK